MCEYCENPLVISAGDNPDSCMVFEQYTDKELSGGYGDSFPMYLSYWEEPQPNGSRWTLDGIGFENYSSCNAYFCPVCGRELPQD